MDECAVRSERAAIMQQEAMARAEVARARQEAAVAEQQEAVAEQQKAVARQEAITANLEKQWAEAKVRREKEEITIRESRERREKLHQEHVDRIEAMMAENKEWTKRIFAELDDQRDERRALIEALFQAIDRLPPPPPHLRSA
jgi:hypothetical protein